MNANETGKDRPPIDRDSASETGDGEGRSREAAASETGKDRPPIDRDSASETGDGEGRSREAAASETGKDRPPIDRDSAAETGEGRSREAAASETGKDRPPIDRDSAAKTGDGEGRSREAAASETGKDRPPIDRDSAAETGDGEGRSREAVASETGKDRPPIDRDSAAKTGDGEGRSREAAASETGKDRPPIDRDSASETGDGEGRSREAAASETGKDRPPIDRDSAAETGEGRSREAAASETGKDRPPIDRDSASETGDGEGRSREAAASETGKDRPPIDRDSAAETGDGEGRSREAAASETGKDRPPIDRDSAAETGDGEGRSREAAASETGKDRPPIDRDSAAETGDGEGRSREAAAGETAFAGPHSSGINKGPIASVVLAGRTNVGKSTLFNRLTDSRDAIEGATGELTRDRHYGSMTLSEERSCLLIDTGGFAGDSPDFAALVEHQAKLAIADADLVAFVVDARAGLTADDEEVADYLRRQGKPALVVVNKVDGPEARRGDQDFHALGLPAMVYISALHGRSLASLREEICRLLPPLEGPLPEAEEDRQDSIAIAGRPNSGKSTLVNRLCGEERMLVSETPGTTRDSIDVAVTVGGRQYNLIDTAGVRRRSGGDAVEDQSIVRSLQAIHRSRAVLLLVDAAEGIRYQDLQLLDHALDSGRAAVVGLNKWDLISRDKRNALLADGREQLRFAATIPLVPLSAVSGKGIGELFAALDRALASAVADIPTPKLTRLLAAALMANPPPAVAAGRRRLRPALRYAHQGGKAPPVVIIHGHRAERTALHWRRYFRNFLSQQLGLVGVLLRLQFHGDKAPPARRRPYSPGRRRSSVKKEASKGN